MKTVKISIEAEVLVVEYCSLKFMQNEEDFDGFNDSYYSCYGFETIQGLYVDDGDDNLIKAKGKYFKTREYFHDLFAADGEHPLPVRFLYKNRGEYRIDYEVSLEDDEEFDISKVQLVKSEREMPSVMPYFIIADYILYNGKKVDAEESIFDIDINGRHCSKCTITKEDLI